MNLSPEIFWDVNPEQIDEEANARFVLERVMTRGTMEDFIQLQERYSKERIKKELVRCPSLDPKTLNFCSIIFGVRTGHIGNR